MAWKEIDAKEYVKLHKENHSVDSPLTLADTGSTIVYKLNNKPLIRVTNLMKTYPKYWRYE